MKKGFLTLFLCLICVITNAAERLFLISRSVNKNVVYYDVHLKNGNLDKTNPIHVYFHNADGSNEELNYIQNKFAYGYKTVKYTEDEAIVILKAYNKRNLTVKKLQNKWVCVMLIDGTECILNEIYVKASPKNSLHVEYVELMGTCLLTGKTHKEIIKNDGKTSVDVKL